MPPCLFFLLLLSIFVRQVIGGCWADDQATCEVNGVPGICANTGISSCCKGGTWTQSSSCGDDDNVQCCTLPTCHTASQDAGTCTGTQNCKDSGKQSASGYCVGPADLQCCLSGEKVAKKSGAAAPDADVPVPDDNFWGVDVSTYVSQKAFQCMKDDATNPVNWVVVRCYQSNNKVDVRACPTLQNATAADIEVRDAYIFPCPLCSAKTSGKDQVIAAVTNLKKNCEEDWNGVLWLDVEGGDKYWNKDKSKNQQFFESLVEGCDDQKIQCDLYTGKREWELIMGTDYTKGSELGMRVWYARYQTPPQPNFKGWKKFGGWDHPTAKQYAGDVNYCGANVDKNWSPWDPDRTTPPAAVPKPPSTTPDDLQQQPDVVVAQASSSGDQQSSNQDQQQQATDLQQPSDAGSGDPIKSDDPKPQSQSDQSGDGGQLVADGGQQADPGSGTTQEGFIQKRMKAKRRIQKRLEPISVN